MSVTVCIKVDISCMYIHTYQSTDLSRYDLQSLCTGSILNGYL